MRNIRLSSSLCSSSLGVNLALLRRLALNEAKLATMRRERLHLDLHDSKLRHQLLAGIFVGRLATTGQHLQYLDGLLELGSRFAAIFNEGLLLLHPMQRHSA